MNEKKTLLLASNSPRRRELLAFTGLSFNVAAADVDESILPNEAPADYVLRLAEVKARASSSSPLAPSASGEETSLENMRGLIVIGSDTAVVDAGEILGKPRDAREAESMLRQLRGRTHQVYTAVAFYDVASDQVLSELSISDVPMRDYSDAELEAYVQTGDPMDKAGGYAIQNAEFHPVDEFAGCYASVMGLPMCHVVRNLKKLGVEPESNIPQLCQSSLNYDCSVYGAILRDEKFG
ncbi:MAG: septum formation protein Maf [Anaerolineae bacterium]|nr:septum formation protein Maf [Anaerolineae bacterium]MBT7070265.1 septum formation protein Maf [Anaerolineae bacterium]MBT7324273.1 septum formation protein Maf [Anaerolineae bacterium]